ncbi:MAG: hypothetical protein GXY18_06805, partial [Methanomicrobiales archaeon]|nr:hypothetical protein [Methanomicrobiales archaeon]
MSDEDPIKILQVRFAKGEITSEQYEQMLSYLVRDISSFQYNFHNKKSDTKPDLPESKTHIQISVLPESHINPEYDNSEEPISSLTEPERIKVKEIATEIANSEEPVTSDTEFSGDKETKDDDESIPDEDFAAGTVLDTTVSNEQIESIEISEEVVEEISDQKTSPDKLLSQEDLGDVCYRTAVNLVQAGEFDKAYPFIEKSLTIQPDLTLSWLYKGFIHHNRKEFEEAIICFDKVVKKEPTQIRAWLFKGYSLFHRHQDEKALECFDIVLKDDKNHLRSLIYKGYCLKNLSRYREASTTFDTAIHLNPKDIILRLNKGICLFEDKQYYDALSAFDKVLELDKRNLSAWLFKIRSLIRMDRIQEAFQSSGKLLEIQPKEVSVWLARADLLIKMKKVEEALEATRKSLLLD